MNFYIKSTITILLTLCAMKVIGQGKVNYSIISNEPESKKMFTEIGLWYVELADLKKGKFRNNTRGFNHLSMGIPISMQYIYKQKFGLRFHTQIPVYADAASSGYAVNVAETANVPKKFSRLEFGGSYTFHQSNKVKPNRVDLSKKYLLKNKVETKYIIVPAKVSVYNMVRGGGYHYRGSLIASDHGSLEVNSPIGDFYVLSNSQRFGNTDDIQDPDGVTTINVNGGYFGVSRLVVKDLVVNASGRDRKVHGYYEMYFDMILANSKIDPFLYQSQSYPITSGFETKKFGWRAGTKIYMNLGIKYLNLIADLQVGKNPGLALQKTNLYLSSGFAFSY